MKVTLDIAWAKRNKLYAEGDKLYAEGKKLYAEGKKLYAEGSKLHAEGHLVFVHEVIRLCGGDTRMEWQDDGSCIVMGVMEFLTQV